MHFWIESGTLKEIYIFFSLNRLGKVSENPKFHVDMDLQNYFLKISKDNLKNRFPKKSQVPRKTV
jgi:hypothetical protein